MSLFAFAFEQAENGRAGARHPGPQGSRGEELLPQEGDPGPLRGHGTLQIVIQRPAQGGKISRFQGVQHRPGPGTGPVGRGVILGKGSLGGHGKARLGRHDPPSVQGGEGLELLAHAPGQCRPAPEAEGHIGPQAQSRLGQGPVGEGHAECLVEQAQDAGGVGAAPRHPRAHWDDLFDIDMNPGVWEPGGLEKELGGLDRQVAAVPGEIGEIAPEGYAPPLVERDGHQVAQVDALEHGLQLVVAVGAEAPHPQVEIELGKGLAADDLGHGFSPSLQMKRMILSPGGWGRGGGPGRRGSPGYRPGGAGHRPCPPPRPRRRPGGRRPPR